MTHRIHFTLRRIADVDLPTVEDVATGQRVAATDQQLLDFGIQRVDGDLYSCVEQYRRDDELLIATGEIKWEAHGVEVPGTLIVDGPDRYQRLPADVRDKIMRASVIRSTTEGQTVLELTAASLEAQEQAIAKFVGPVDDAPLVDLWTPDAGVQEASRLADIPDGAGGVERITLRMGQVKIDDVVETDMIEPHRWAGERRR